MHQDLEPHAAQLIGRPQCFERERLRAAGRALDPQLVEKAVHALEYVGQLARINAEMIFTGGTATQVLLASRGDDDAIRLSKDVDLLSPSGDAADWRRATGQVADQFARQIYVPSEDARTHGGLTIPAIHFLVRYPTWFPSDTRPDIELDVVFGGSSVPTQKTPLKTRLFEPKEPVSVTTPTIESMLGGKLTTLGPGTIGIPRDKSNFDVATGKQLYDIDRLLRHVQDLEPVAQTYLLTYEQQITYHPENDRPSLTAVLEDGLYVLKVLSAQPGTQANDEQWTSDLASLGRVAEKLRGYVGSGSGFDRRGVAAAAARAALALSAIRIILFAGEPPSEISLRWRETRRRLAEAQRDAGQISDAKKRLREVSWEKRPHINLKTFDQLAGGEALLCWDAVFGQWY